jgi:carboxypeptidase C (cathepsin A)
MQISKMRILLLFSGIISFLVDNKVATTPYRLNDPDRVHELEEMPDLSFGLFSGYVPIRYGKFNMHYITALSQGDYMRDPIIFWFNGGPGCSSLLGFAQENGPYILSDEKGARFKWNEHSWNKEATVVYLSFPIGVGFSFPCEVNSTSGDCIASDNSTARDNMEAILTYMNTKMPELIDNPVYIAGESYAGIYIPYLMRELDSYLSNEKSEFKINLKGMMIGNGLTSYQWDCIPAFLDMAPYHNLLDEELHERLSESCTW